MLIKSLLCGIFLILINITDIKGYKIKNKIVLPTVMIGLLWGIISNSFLDSLYGMLIPMVLFPLYALKMLGAGDVKALCAIGAVLGFRLSVMTLVFTFVAGGIIALLFMLFRKNAVERFRYLFRYFRMCFATRKILNYDFGGEGKSYFRFSFAITAGTVLSLVVNHLSV